MSYELLFGVLVVVGAIRLFYATRTSEFGKLPGPLAARFTRLWLLRRIYLATFHKDNIELHCRYGPIVRIAPDQFSIDDPSAAKQIYGPGSKYTKADWYIASTHPNAEVKSIFVERDPRLHAAFKRKVASAYSMSSLVSLESFVDECTGIMAARLTEFAESGQVFDLSHWLQCFAFDVIGKITVGTRFGFLDRGEDIEGVMDSVTEYLTYSARVGVFPELHRILFRLTELSGRMSGLSYSHAFAKKYMDAHAPVTKADPDDTAPADFVTRLRRIQAEDPGKLSDAEIDTTCMTNIGAGSDTTSVSFSAVFFYLGSNPESLDKLMAEILDADRSGRLSDPVKFSEAQQLPYLQAVIKEALRLHPATGLILGRIVPKGGAVLAGQYFPEGTTVGINPWVAHRNKSVFGDDVDSFRPERWLESPEEVSKREAYFMSFGLGSRTCIGRNISLMEISKALPQLLRQFTFVPEGGVPQWSKAENVWFVKHKNLRYTVRLR